MSYFRVLINPHIVEIGKPFNHCFTQALPGSHDLYIRSSLFGKIKVIICRGLKHYNDLSTIRAMEQSTVMSGKERSE